MTDCKPRATASEEAADKGRFEFVIKSENEPKIDADALALVGISMTPPPQVLYRNFTAGMEDHMDLVIRFPKNRIEDFWSGSKWDRKDSKSIKAIGPGSQTIYEDQIRRIGGHEKSPILDSIRKSTDGIWCDEPRGSTVGLKLFLSLDQDENDIIAYVEWFQT